jgi:hypothetical protein
MNQIKYFFYGFSRNSQNPLDPRLKISSLSNIATELLIEYRYSGLIFFVEDINKHYLFLNDLNTPIALQTLLSNGQINGIISNDYSTLLSSLNSTNPTLGSLVTVFPLNVTFIFNGTNWEYFNGDYNVLNNTIFDSIPNQLRSVNKLIIIDDVRYLFNSDLTKSEEIIVVTEKPLNPEQNRYYKINDILYLSINNEFHKLSEKYLFLENYSLVNGINTINHNLNSSYISGLIWINITNDLNNVKKTIQLEIEEIDLNSSNIISSLNLTGNILLTSNL